MFYYIIQHIIKNKFKTLPIKKRPFRNLSLFFITFEDYISPLTKFKKNIFDNTYIPPYLKKILCDVFFRMLFIRRILKRFLSTLKKRHHSRISYDLYMQDLDYFPSHQKITLIQENTFYQFRLSDLLTLWISNLNNNEEQYPTPIKFKNPYTNIVFENHNLYNIYFALQNSNFIIPPLLTQFFMCNFDIQLFLTKNYIELKDNAILCHLKEQPTNILFEEILLMIDTYKNILISCIPRNNSSNLYQKNFVSRMFEYLEMFFLHRYSLNPLMRTFMEKKLIQNLKKFEREHKNFGKHIPNV